MVTAINIAAYISDRYKKEYGVNVDEMKLHKLLYFSQREALIQLNEPLFSEKFSAWKYGPVLVDVRNTLHSYNGFQDFSNTFKLPEKYQSVLDKVFSQYACKSSWSLSRLSHGEFSWRNARNSISQNMGGDDTISLEDIMTDANRIKNRRIFISELRKR